MVRTSGFLQLLDNEPPPLESREDTMRKERLLRAAEKKQQFLEELHIKQLHVHLDHSYASEPPSANVSLDIKVPVSENSYLVNELYTNHVCITRASIGDLKLQTRAQCNSDRWHYERVLRVTSSIMKEVCHRRDSTSAFIFKKTYSKDCRCQCNTLWKKV